MNTPQDPLGSDLANWRVQPRRDPAFRQSVWARLEAARRSPTWPAYARAHATVVATVLVLALGLGAMAGREQARARVAADSRALADAYVQSLDARSMRMP